MERSVNTGCLMNIPILLATPHFVVLNKPAGLPVHPGPAGGPSVEDSFAELTRRKDGPWLAHRLDADTSRCLLVALRKAPLLAAQAAFAEGRVVKTYWAVVVGGPQDETGDINAPIAKRTTKQGWRMEVGADGMEARTSWRVLGRGNGLAWLELTPHTGRTHQIRVHAASGGWPILGDPLYGQPGAGLHLLARSLSVPVDPPISATAPPPAAMRVALAACGWK
jgi:tRNA pseudouridine32 synthase/23S rRNA pseudouridine746 synthase